MTGSAPSGTQVERVLEDLIARLSRAEASKEVRAALIEARRLRSVTLTWTAIPPPPDARREMLTKVMDLVARVGVGAAPRPSAEVRAEAFATLAPPPTAPGDSPPPPRKPGTMPPPGGAGTRRDPKQPSAPPPPAEDPPTSSPRMQTPAERRPMEDLSLELGPLPMPPPTGLPANLAGLSEGRQRLNTPQINPQINRRNSPIPFRKAPSAQDFAAVRTPGITAVGHESATLRGGDRGPDKERTDKGERPRRAFGTSQGTQTNLSRPLRTSVSTGVHLVRPQATAWQAYPRVPGAKLKILWRDAESGACTALLHLAPGTTMPARRHAAVEEMLLVEGSAQIGTWDMRPGEYCRAEAGSIHDPIRSEEGCTFFVTGSDRDEIVEDSGT